MHDLLIHTYEYSERYISIYVSTLPESLRKQSGVFETTGRGNRYSNEKGDKRNTFGRICKHHFLHFRSSPFNMYTTSYICLSLTARVEKHEFGVSLKWCIELPHIFPSPSPKWSKQNQNPTSQYIRRTPRYTVPSFQTASTFNTPEPIDKKPWLLLSRSVKFICLFVCLFVYILVCYEIGGACSTYGRDVKCIQIFGLKT
jgi:hypothetical protein